MSAKFALNIQCISAWAPSLETPEQWCVWAKTSNPLPLDGSAAPSISFVPASLRRRCSDLAKASLAVAHTCSMASSVVPRTVFASRHGEAVITSRLLEALAKEEQLSPTDFSLSIHNGTSGLFSIATKNIEPSTALTGGKYTVASGLVEAALSAQVSRTPVLLIISDEAVPVDFTAKEPELGNLPVHALALLCHASSDNPASATIHMSFQPTDKTEDQEYHTPDFIRWFLSQNETTTIPAAGGRWTAVKMNKNLDHSKLLIPLHAAN